MATLGMVTPIIATIKNNMDNKDKIGNASTLIHPIQYQVSEEDSIDTTGTETTSDERNSTSAESTKNTDKNRKF